MADNHSRCVSRRKVLKNSAAAVTGIGLSSIGAATTAARGKKRSTYGQALHILDKTESKERFEEYLLNHGFDIESSTEEFTVRGGNPTSTNSSGDEIRINKFEHSDLSLTSSIKQNTYTGAKYAYADWSVSSTSNGFFDDGDTPSDPKDIVSIQWSDIDYDLDGTVWDSGPDVSQRKANPGTGVAFEYEDAGPNNDYIGSGGEDYCSSYATCKIQNNQNSSSRKIFVNYIHTWFGGKVTGVSMDATGNLSVGVGFQAQKWDTPVQSISID